MGTSPICWTCSKYKKGLHREAWTASEDKILSEYIQTHGVGRWRSLPKKARLKRRGKSCRLRWLNYLRQDIKRGNISAEEDDLLIRLHRLLGNRWALIAGRFPGRTGNEIKNYWNTHLSKRVQLGELQPKSRKPLKRRVVPSYSNYDEEGVVHKDISTSENTPVKPTADTHDGMNQEGLKATDDAAVEIDTSKSWCQLLLEDCMADYQGDPLHPNSMISTSCRTNHHHESPSPSLSGSVILQENKTSSSCNFFDKEFTQSKDFNSSYFDSFLDLGELPVLIP